MQKLAKNALAIVSELGKPTLFLTVTCNQKWPEIDQRLLPGQSAFDRPDIVILVFHERLATLMSNLRNNKYFREDVVYDLRSIEYQHRGMPHAHIVIALKDVPTNDDGSITSSWIDSNLTAELLSVCPTSSTEDLETARRVRMHMKHHCSNSVNGCLNAEGLCTKGFHHTVIQENSHVKPNGRVVYRRRNETDLLIVPHNTHILKI